MRVVICGGGVIGASIAYYLSRRGVETTVVERAEVANAASGKSGGFLALDWCGGSALDELARRSFALHAALAATLAPQLGLDWGYRRVRTLSVAASERHHLAASGMASPAWLGQGASVRAEIGSEETTAQLDPAAFTRALMTAACAGGAEVRAAAVEGVRLTEAGRRATGIVADGEVLSADAVVLAMGPWSILACQWLPLPGVYGLKGHSLLFRFAPADPAALFVELETETGFETPEVFPRADGTTYVCGLSGDTPLPADPAQVISDEGASERLRELTAAFSPHLGGAEVLASQACYRPITQDGLPLIGKVPGVEAAYVATGHSVWGMLNGPATGEAMAELIVGGEARTVDLAPFDAGRLPVFDATRLDV